MLKLPSFSVSELSQNKVNIYQVCLLICPWFVIELQFNSKEEIWAQGGAKN